MKKKILEMAEILHAANKIGRELKKPEDGSDIKLYGVPRGGLMAAHYVSELCPHGCQLVYNASEADYIIDDLVDSGATKLKYISYKASFLALFDKTKDKEIEGVWLVFPWETEEESTGPEDAVIRLLEYMGEDVNREGLSETPGRVLKAWEHWTSGYNIKPEDILKTFEDGAEGDGEMVVIRNIPLYSKCEHHLADIIGSATVSYIPHGKIVGLSKLNRLVDIYARRLQVQERLTTQIADAIVNHLSVDCAVRIQARHMCMESRGVCQHGHSTVTSALRGVFKTQPETRAEFYALCNDK